MFQANGVGRTVIALRGMEPGSLGQLAQDLIKADVLGLALRKKAYGQVADAYRYYRQLTMSTNDVISYAADELSEMRDLVSFHLAGMKYIQLDPSVPFEQGHKAGVDIYFAAMVKETGFFNPQHGVAALGSDPTP